MKKAILSLQKAPSSDGSFCREMDEMDIRTCLKERMIHMTKEALLKHVDAVIAAPSCYAGLKKKAEAYRAAVGKADEKNAAKALLAELKEDVQSIDAVIPFFASDKAKEIFGADTAASLLAQANEVKAKGGDTCFCPACSNGKTILDNASVLLG